MNKKGINNIQAASILECMLYEHNNNCGFIDFDSENEEEMELAEEWRNKKQALELAIKVLKNNK